MKLIPKGRKQSRSRNKRFYTSKDMAIIKQDIAIKNAEIKRGERVDLPNNYICECGCGIEGCFIHGQFETIKQPLYR